MPATAGRVRMPANNRVHSSAALQTHGIWQSAIGYDPYAPVSNKKESKPDNDPENAYASFKGLLALARITSGGPDSDETRGACRKCGRIGHLTYQCRNFLSLKDEKEGDDSALRAANAVFEKIKKAKEEAESEDDGDESESESESSDSSVDPEIERIIAERFGKPMSKKVGSLKKRSNSSGDDDDDDEDEEERKHKHERGRHRHRRKKRRDSDGDESDSDGNRKRRRRGKRRMSDSESSSEESDGHRGRRRSRRRKERRSVLSSDSESTASSSDEGERRKRREKRRRRRGHKREQRY